MRRKIFENCVVTIENDKTKKMMWLEEHINEKGKTTYHTQKIVEYKKDIQDLKLLNESNIPHQEN